jgi:hypothetical protein
LLVLAASALLADRSVVVLIGGAAVTPFSDGITLLDKRTLSWSHPRSALPRQRVARRYSAAAALVGSTLLLFGGTELNRAAGAHAPGSTGSEVHAVDLSPTFAELHRLAARAAASTAAADAAEAEEAEAAAHGGDGEGE